MQGTIIRIIVFLIILLSISFNGFTQVVYVTSIKVQADYILYETNIRSESKEVVLISPTRSGTGKGKWYFTKNRSEANLIVYFTNIKSEANRIVYFVGRGYN